MRGYSVATAALALGVDAKWLDNLLSHHRVDGVTQARQGVARRLGPGAMHVIATVHQMNRNLQIPVAAAIRLANDLWRSPQNADPGDTATARSGDLALRLDRAEVRSRVAAALTEALEIAPRTKRGRPPASRTAAPRPAL